ncbi:BsaA family SipW-dependent biofilm matrix protein [Vagococcus sp.]|uniref:BsaA family SipW-dependent biofilm matrix protein n=1 Tax=Vagococcus sp. TaxID=1933889 RepID=UPI002FCC9F26
MKNLRKNKKFVMGSSIALALVMILAATFAWFTASDSAENKFKTGGIPSDSVKVWEIFKEPEDWKPGEKVDKKVGVANLGKEPVLVRATFTEVINKLKANGESLAINDSPTIIKDDNSIPVPVTSMAGKDGWGPASPTYKVEGLPAGVDLLVKTVDGEKSKQIFYSAISTEQKGAVKADFSFNEKTNTITAEHVSFRYYTLDTPIKDDWRKEILKTKDKIDFSKVDDFVKLAYDKTGFESSAPTADKWFYNENDGWFYFVGTVKGGEVTPFFLDSVTLDNKANNTYQFMSYKLTVHTEGLQSTKEALGQWDLDKPINKDLYDAIVATLK